jgi:hypothetical protein
MSNTTDTFAKEIFQYINDQYGKAIVKNIQSDKHKTTVNKLVESSHRDNNNVAHAANKIVAMLRMNP